MNLAELSTIQVQQYHGCLDALSAFRQEMTQSNLPIRRQGQLTERLHFFLQQITIFSEFTARTANQNEAESFVQQCKGLHEYDLRQQMLEILGRILNNPNIILPKQPGSPAFRELNELLLWQNTAREIYRRTKPHFDSITEEQIIDHETRCVPFYLANLTHQPSSHDSGVFLDSDDAVISGIRSIKGFQENQLLAIADLGCGEGRLLKRFSHLYPNSKLTGTSIFKFSREQESLFQSAHIEIAYGPSQRINLADHSHDIVVSTEVIEHLRHPEAMVREIYRILKPGGVYCVTAPLAQAHYFNRNPFSYLCVLLDSIVPGVLPPFHNLYAPLTDLKIVHYGFDRRGLLKLFQAQFPNAQIRTGRFIALKKFRIDRHAAHLPLLKNLGGLGLVMGIKPE